MNHLSSEEGLAVLKVRVAVLQERIKRREETLAFIKAAEEAEDELATFEAATSYSHFCYRPFSLYHRIKHFFGFSDLSTAIGRDVEKNMRAARK